MSRSGSVVESLLTNWGWSSEEEESIDVLSD